MGWARLDDGYAMHPKLIAAGIEATGLDARAISHCAKYETNGFIAHDEALMLSIGAKKPAVLPGRLVDNRRWHRFNGSGPCSDCRCLSEHGIDWSGERRQGYVIHDYLVYNDSREKLEAKRKAERIRKSSGRNPSGQPPDGAPDSEEKPSGSDLDSEPRPPLARSARVRPVPSRPSPNSPPLQNTGVSSPAEEEEEDLKYLENNPDVMLAVGEVAKRRMAKRAEPPRYPQRWIEAAVANVVLKNRADLRQWAEEGLSGTEMADLLEPAPQSQYKPFDSEDQPVWDIDDNGRAVRVEAQ